MYTNKELDEMITKIDLLNAQIDTADNMVKELKEKIKAELDERKECVVITDYNKIIYQPVESWRLDTKLYKAYIAEHGLDEHFLKKSSLSCPLNLHHLPSSTK